MHVAAEPQLCVVPGQRASVYLTDSAVNPFISHESYCTVLFMPGRYILFLPMCVCAHVSVLSHHSKLIKYGDVSMLQARMIKRKGLNVKPFRDRRKQSRKPSWMSYVSVCASIVAVSLKRVLSGLCGLSLSLSFLLHESPRKSDFFLFRNQVLTLDTALCLYM